MRKQIDCFLPCENIDAINAILPQFRQSKTIQHIYLLVSQTFAMHHQVPDNCSFIVVDNLLSTNTMLSSRKYGCRLCFALF